MEEKELELTVGTPLFRGMTTEEIQTALHCVQGRKITCFKGDYLFRAGETTDQIGLLLSGTAIIVQEDFWGHRNVMAKLLPGDTFAETFAAVPGFVLNVSVAAEENCRVLLLRMQKLLTVCPSACPHHNQLVRNLVTVLAQKNLMLHEKITHMSRRKTRDKLLSYLSAEAIRQGSAALVIPYDRQQLADYLCVERAAMSVELSKLQKEGLLTVRRNHITLSPNWEENGDFAGE